MSPISVVAIVFGLAVVAWLAGLIYVSDFAIPFVRMPLRKRILVIFPHPDDETNIAGTLWRLGRRQCEITLVVLTEGECGTPDAHFDPKLGARRRKEMQQVAKLLGAKKLIQENFGDGKLAGQEHMLQVYLEQLITAERPNIVISYDLAGLYGHQDHIACAEVLHEILTRKFPDVSFWLSAWSSRMIAISNLPEHMASDPSFKQKRAHPNACIFTSFGVIMRIRAVYAHVSQRRSFKDNSPKHLAPWLVHSWQIFEYFEILR